MQKRILIKPRNEEHPFSMSIDIKLKELRRGCYGKEVQTMQRLLIMEGFSCGRNGASGMYDEDTQDAVESFQMASGLFIDGICGKETWTKLLK